MSKDLHKLESVLSSIEKIKRYSAGMDYDSFAANDVVIDAVLMHFINLGEKLGNISDDFKTRHPEISYRKAKDMRNYIAHQYEGIDVNNVWSTMTTVIPELEIQLMKIINER